MSDVPLLAVIPSDRRDPSSGDAAAQSEPNSPDFAFLRPLHWRHEQSRAPPFGHRLDLSDGFTRKYRIDKLLWYKAYDDIRDAIACKKQSKGWKRSKKAALIEREKLGYVDISEEWHITASPESLQDVG